MPKETIYPLLCQPVLKEKVWGGRKLESLYGFELPPEEKIGEAWMVADLPEGASTVLNGPWAGSNLSEVTARWGTEMIGSAWKGAPTGGRFPLLIKFLDAADDLSVQVHPSQDDCRRHFPEAYSKDESWLVVQNDPGGSILHGFHPELTLEDFDRALDEGRVVETMRRVEVQPGQCFRVSPGTVHALCRGVAILEIQEPSDTTFRIFDYDRPGLDGKPRPLHLDESRKVMRFGDPTPPALSPVASEQDWGRHELVVDAPAYRIERAETKAPLRWRTEPLTAQALILLEGKAGLTGGGEILELTPGSTVVLPAALGDVELRPAPGGARLVLAGAGGVPILPA